MNPLSQLPSVDRLLSATALAADRHPRPCRRHRQHPRSPRHNARRAQGRRPLPDEAALIARVGAGVTAKTQAKLRPVFNLTGTVLHTNLGRAPLPEEAVQALVTAARNPCALEYDIESGGRGDRDNVVANCSAN
jgi:L-seryl-tRNA(Ser) seleniumtransferase